MVWTANGPDSLAPEGYLTSKVHRGITGEIVLSKGGKFSQYEIGRDWEVVGFDMEADAKTADPFLVTIDYGEQEARDIEDWKGVLGALARERFLGTVNFWYNLQYDFEGMIRYLDPEVLVRLYGGQIVRVDDGGTIVETGGWEIGYTPKKSFMIKKGKQKWRWFDAWQFFQCGLAKAMKDNLGSETKGGLDASKISAERYREDGDYRRELVAYALQDAKGCRLLAEIIVRGANQFVGTRSFYSSARVSEDYFKSLGFSVPRLGNGAVVKDTMRSYHGGRFEMVKRGWFGESTCIDIKSAYPFAMKDMPILTDGVEVRRVKDVDSGAEFGSYRCRVEVDKDSYFGPLAVDNGLLTFPVGCLGEVWLDKVTLGLLDKLGVWYEVMGGVEYHDPAAEYWLRDKIDSLYDLKETATEPSLRYFAKIALNGFYGKLIQLVDDVEVQEIADMSELDTLDYGDLILVWDKSFKRVHTGKFMAGALFSPMYASYVTAYARRQLLEKGLEIGEDRVIAMHTDSILMRGVYGGETGRALGDWEIETMKLQDGTKVQLKGREMAIAKCGFYEIHAEGETKVRARGVGRPKTITDLEYDVKRRFGLNQAVKHDLDKLNVISEMKVQNRFGADRKRQWDRELEKKTFERREWIDSRPLVVD